MFGIEKQLDRIVETLALSALARINPSKKVEKRLKEIAFPLEIELWIVNVANNLCTGNLAVKKTQTIADTVMELWLDKWEDQEKQYNHSHLV